VTARPRTIMTARYHQFTNDVALLERYGVTDSELQIMERHFARSSLSPEEYVAILVLIRGIHTYEQQSEPLSAQHRISLEHLQAAAESLLDAIKLARRKKLTD
jgi:hypothetical protein